LSPEKISDAAPAPDEPKSDIEKVPLKDPALAAFLAWLIPGLGHWYQGRRAKAVLFFICIMGTFVYGLYLGSSNETGWGRVVYFSWKPQDKRLYYLCQVGVGLPAMPALVQAIRVRNGNAPFGRFMAPPALAGAGGPAFAIGEPSRLTLSELIRRLGRYFELGTIFTSIAGLLNIVVIFDAYAGPVCQLPAHKEDEKENKSEQSQ
jgi:Family of unknown function (DUF6677)